jgi:hypothetical protein
VSVNPALTTQTDSMWTLHALAECLLAGPVDGPVNVGLARDLARAALVADDTLRRLSEWDHLPLTADGPFWQGEIRKARGE